MNNLLWNEFSNIEEDNKDHVKLILKSFNDIINGLLLLEDHNYIFNNLGTPDFIKDYYFNVCKRGKSFIKLANEIEKLRNIIFGEAIDWDEIERSLK